MPARHSSRLPARALSASLRLAGGRASQWQAGSGEAGAHQVLAVLAYKRPIPLILYCQVVLEPTLYIKRSMGYTPKSSIKKNYLLSTKKRNLLSPFLIRQQRPGITGHFGFGNEILKTG